MRSVGNRGVTCAPGSSPNGEGSRGAERPPTIVRPKPPATFDELFDWWMKEYGSRLRGQFEGFLRKRLVRPLDKLPVEEVTSARIEELLQHQVDELSPKSLNELRGTLHRIFKRATQRGFWHGPNPAATVEKRKVPHKLFDTLRADEVPRLLAALSPSWRPLFATAIWTAMRKGELLGLQKNDIDFVTSSIAVRRSYDHETTKGGHADLLPIASQLRPYLEQAMDTSRSDLVFPTEDGEMRTRNTKLQYVLGRALSRAGLVAGYRHICRRHGCGHREQARDGEPRRCPKCNMKLLTRGIPRKLRFHDLRATTATLLARAGVPLVIAQRILRHSDPRLTANIYSRVDLADLQAGIDRLGIRSI